MLSGQEHILLTVQRTTNEENCFADRNLRLHVIWEWNLREQRHCGHVAVVVYLETVIYASIICSWCKSQKSIKWRRQRKYCNPIAGNRHHHLLLLYQVSIIARCWRYCRLLWPLVKVLTSCEHEKRGCNTINPVNEAREWWVKMKFLE